MGERKYFLDWLRVAAFGFLILFHVGMLYVSWPYNLKSPRLVTEIEPLMNALGAFRLALLFLISGVASRFLIGRLGPGRFALDRLRRLLPAILFAMFVVIPPQTYIELVSKGVWHGDYWSFWFTQYLPAKQALVRPLHKTMPTWDHVWFVVYLLIYTLLFALGFAITRGLRFSHPPLEGGSKNPERSEGFFGKGSAKRETDPSPKSAAQISTLPQGEGGDRHRIPIAVLLVVPALWLPLANLLIRYRFPVTDALVNDWGGHVKWIGMFALGVYAAGYHAFWETLRRYHFASLAVALPLLALQSMINDPWWSIVNGLYGWAAICTLAGFAAQYLNRPSPVLSHLNEAVLPIYILHQPILLFAAYYVFALRLPLAVEALVIALITAAGCFAIYEALIRPFNISRFLFGLKIRQASIRRAKEKRACA